MTRLVLVAIALAAALAHPAAAQPARVDRYARDTSIADDRSWKTDVEQDITILSGTGLQQMNRLNWSFDPASQDVDVLEAYVTQPDGTRVEVGAGGIFTRPSAAAQNAPGFTSSQTTTIVFPQLRVGSQTHSKLRIVQRTPQMFGFNEWDWPFPDLETREMHVTVTAPAAMALHHAARGGWAETETVEDGRTRIAATLTGVHAHPLEINSVGSSDFQPLFQVSSLPDWETIGALYYEQSAPRSAVTPEVQALAAKIVGGKTGRPAAEAIYDWVSANIRYVALFLDTNAGWVPHPANDVIARGYGDCKDHVALMQALLQAVGIESDPVLINWGTRYRTPPLQTPALMNHAIIYLPQFDVYANPTNAFAGFGTLDHRLEGKMAVLATKTGRVVQIPAGRPDAYRYRLHSEQVFAADGAAVGTASMTMSPAMESNERSIIGNAPSGLVLGNRLLANTPEGGFGSVESTDARDLETPLVVHARWRSPHAMLASQDRVFLQVPGGIDFQPVGALRSLIDDTGRQRRQPMTSGARDYAWEYVLRFPPGMTADRLPADVSIVNGSGRYEASYAMRDGTLHVSRRLVTENDVVPPSEMEGLRRLIYAALDDSRQTLALTAAPPD